MNAKNATGSTDPVDPDDAPELAKEFFEQAEIRHGETLIRRGRPPKGSAKPLVSLRMDPEVLRRLRETGPGWQTRAAEALRRLAEGTK